jgi:hypothetical protein
VKKGVVLMKKVTNCVEGIDINFGFVVLKFKKLNVSEVTIAREPSRGNEFKRVVCGSFLF